MFWLLFIVKCTEVSMLYKSFRYPENRRFCSFPISFKFNAKSTRILVFRNQTLSVPQLLQKKSLAMLACVNEKPNEVKVQHNS